MEESALTSIRILSAALLLGLSSHLTQAQETRLLRYPAIHGDTVIFSYASDLWVADRKGSGPARRLTTHRGDERLARISPDGRLVAFLASYDGDPDLYVMPVEGGAPRRLTYDTYNEGMVGWTPDGRIAYTSAAGSPTARQARLWLVKPTGGLPEETPLAEFSDGSFFPDGKRIAYNRTNVYARNWRRYRGGSAGRIAIYDFAKNTYSELPSGRESSWFPMVIGNAIYYASDRDGTVNLYRHDLATAKDVQLTKYTEADLRWPSTDGRTIVYENGGWLYAFDVASGREEKLSFEVRGDDLGARPAMMKVSRRMEQFSLSPDGARVAVEARGEVFNVAAESGEARNLTATPGVRERFPRWSPDGKSILYLSDATGEFQICARPAAGGPEKVLSRHQGSGIRGFLPSPDDRWIVYWTEESRMFLLDPKTGEAKPFYKTEYEGPRVLDWSPDSRWIAFIGTGRNAFGSVHLYEVATGRVTRVTDGFYDDSNVTFDLSGKYLYFTSARNFQPTQGRFEESLKVEKADGIYLLPLASDQKNPFFFPKSSAEGAEEKKDAKAAVRIDLDGLGERIVALPVPPGESGELIGTRDGVYHYAGGKLRKFDLKSREMVTIYDGPEIFTDFDAERRKLAWSEPGSGALAVADAKPGLKPGDGKVDLAALEAWVDPRAEWRQMFWETWRFERDNFFRADMAGLDWKAVGKRYEQMLPYAGNGSDLRYILGLMLGELGTSHAYIDPPPGERGEAPPPSAASLGVDYERDGRFVRFKKIYPGTLTREALRGPLGEPGLNVKAGDYLLEIEGQPVDADVNPNSLLIGKANRIVTLTVNGKASTDGARRIQVRPIANERELRYYEWVEENRRKVDKLSGGRIGYIHYPNTGREGQVEFIRGYWAQTDKDALILDERFNGGGSPQPMVLPTLARRSQTVVVSRKFTGLSEVQAINGPKAMLINGYAGSGGDLTPYMFRDAGMGTLIGTRTMGALVGIADDRDLMDGTNVTAPGYTRFDPKTGDWIAENQGIEPDVEVDARPDLIAGGSDPQLEKAVEVLLEQLRKNPVKTAEPKFPGKSGG
jgi:tricorn protease